MRLLRKPGCGAAAEDLRQAYGHLGRNSRFSLTSSESVVRVTPRAAAAWVMVKPKGSIHWRSTKPPGCGGFFILMVFFTVAGGNLCPGPHWLWWWRAHPVRR